MVASAGYGRVAGPGSGRALPEMDNRIPYDDYPVVFLPAYENPPAWIPPHEVGAICVPEEEIPIPKHEVYER